MLEKCPALCVKGMINNITDSHQEMIYRTAGLEISSLENIRSEVFFPYLKIPLEELRQGYFYRFFQNNFSIGPLSFVYV